VNCVKLIKLRISSEIELVYVVSHTISAATTYICFATVTFYLFIVFFIQIEISAGVQIPTAKIDFRPHQQMRPWRFPCVVP